MRNKKLKVATVNSSFCVACGSCIKVCPTNSISIKNGISAIINSTTCLGCGICSKICPASTIDIINLSGGESNE